MKEWKDYKIRFKDGNEKILSSKIGLSEIIKYLEDFIEINQIGISSMNDIISIERID